jgi:CRP/FNR family transcriptional regulator, cyclic AMP receptor protein
MNARRIQLLQEMPVFGAVRTDVLEFLLGLSRTLQVTRGDYFFRQGDPGEVMFVLESGAVEVLKGGGAAGQEPRLLKRLGTGDCFGEMALMDLAPRSASVRAVEDCIAIEISAADLMRVYERDVKQFVLIEMNMGRELSRRLREVDERLFPGA